MHRHSLTLRTHPPYTHLPRQRLEQKPAKGKINTSSTKRPLGNNWTWSKSVYPKPHSPHLWFMVRLLSLFLMILWVYHGCHWCYVISKTVMAYGKENGKTWSAFSYPRVRVFLPKSLCVSFLYHRLCSTCSGIHHHTYINVNYSDSQNFRRFFELRP